jgi:hypothetical protein
MMINEQRVGKAVKGLYRGLNEGIIPIFAWKE